MKRDEVLNLLGEHRAELDQFDVKSLALFGSMARDEAGPESDIDFLVEFNGTATFRKYTGLLLFLEDLLNCKVDLVTQGAVKPRLQPHIDRDLVHVA